MTSTGSLGTRPNIRRKGVCTVVSCMVAFYANVKVCICLGHLALSISGNELSILPRVLLNLSVPPFPIGCWSMWFWDSWQLQQFSNELTLETSPLIQVDALRKSIDTKDVMPYFFCNLLCCFIQTHQLHRSEGPDTFNGSSGGRFRCLG